MPLVVFYVSGHGFGHASRQIEVINALRARQRDVGIQVRTWAPRWLFDLTANGSVDYRQVECDVGVVQIDSLTPDIPATIAKAAAFYGDGFPPRVEAEARALAPSPPDLIVGDVPPLAFAVAAALGVPAVAIANFTWDWIYSDYADLLGDAAWLPGRLAELQSTAAEAWRLPMAGGFASYASIRDLPFIARRSRRNRAETRSRLGLPRDGTVVLDSFGGVGLDGLPLDDIAAGSPFTLVTTDVPTRHADGAARPVATVRPGGLVVLDERALYASGLRYEDVVAAADVVVTKPGYGIIAEAVAHGTAVLYTSRGRFAEYQVLVDALPRLVRSRFIDQDDLRAGRWQPHVERLLAQPAIATRTPVDGAEAAAGRITQWLGGAG